MATATLLDIIKSGGLATKDLSLEDQLAAAKKFDPNAYIADQGGGDDAKFQRLFYDESKAPKLKEGYTPNLKLDPGYVENGQHAPRQGARNDRAIWDKDYGYIVPTGDVGSIDEKANNAQQNASGGLFSKIGNAIVPSNKPWMVIPEAIGAGIAGSGMSGMEKALTNFGMNAATSGGQSLSNPMSYVNAALGAVGDIFPPEIMKTMGYVKTAYGWIKNPVSSAINTGAGFAMNKLFGGK